MEAAVVEFLIQRCRRRESPVTACEIRKLLNLPASAKSNLNRLLYKTKDAIDPADNLLGLPRQYRLIFHATKVPQWNVVPNCADELLNDPDVVAAWHIYARLCAKPNTPVDVAEMLPQGDDATVKAMETMRDNMLTPHESIEQTGETTLVLRILDPVVDNTVELNCDRVLSGARRDNAHCVLLGMAIMECVVANRNKEITLVSRDPGVQAILRYALKTNEYARSLNVRVVAPPTQPE